MKNFLKNILEWVSGLFPARLSRKITDTASMKNIRDMLRNVITKGTGQNAKITGWQVAGKTGTAEDSTGGSDHAWFVCFAPYDSSEIVVVAFAQNTPGGGSVHAVPMAREVLEAWQRMRIRRAIRDASNCHITVN